jgi:dethiobiotin synthetase
VPGLFIAGTGTEVGKTYVAAALVRGLRLRGHRVDALKPVASGFDPAHPEASDAGALLAALGEPITAQSVQRISPWRFTAPLSPPLAARREGRRLDADEVFALCRGRIREAGPALVVVEAAGGLMSPVDDSRTMLDLAVALEGPVLLVAGSYLGTISHVLTAVEALRGRGAALLGLAVSESLEAPPLAETLAALHAFLPTTPILTVPRNGEAPEALVALAAAVG